MSDDHQFLTLEAKSHKGKNRISEAQRRLPMWDGKTWRVVEETKFVAFSRDPGPWALVMPATEENTDWCSRWVNLREDDNFTVTLELTGSPLGSPLERPRQAQLAEGPLEAPVGPQQEVDK